MKRFYGFLAAISAAAIALTACGGGGGNGSSSQPPTIIPPVAQTPAPPPPSGSQSVGCPSSGPASQSVAVSTGGGSQTLRRGPETAGPQTRYVPGLITVTFNSADAAQSVSEAASSLDARPLETMRLQSLGIHARALYVDPAKTAAVMARLRTMHGVVSVEQAQYRHTMAAVSPNDPYYRGFGASSPWFETATTPGQWDMHVINVGAAWGAYATLPVRGAPIAIIDTGVDVTHPELSGGKIVRQFCYVTYPAGTTTTGPYAIDTDGHGTNVAGIADANTNNNFGFVGVAYDAPLLVYRIFPTTPSGGCENSTSAQCSTTNVDEASAINDAVAHGAKVINLSLGATGPLSNCKDTVEYNAVESAIAKGVVVVAAAGNESNASLDCPAAYPGVIAVGAEGPGGTSDTTETVAAYSNYTTASGGGSGGIYLVAPGGTANSGSDSDDLHFVENITSSQMSGASAYCKVDYAGQSGDCRGGFSGTSQATPHVTGVASLILGLRPGLSPAQVAADICSTAHSIGDTAKQGCGRVDAGAAVSKALAQ